MPRPLADLAHDIATGAVRLAAATAAWLRLVAEFDEREGWAGYGVRSCAHWLAWQCGLGPGAAREHVRVAGALRRLPLIEEAFSGGHISYSKVRALTRVADADSEAALLELALETTASQIERVVRAWRRADRVDTETVAATARFESWWDDDGMLVLRARMPPEEGAALLTAVESLAERAARRERAQTRRERGSPQEGQQSEHGRRPEADSVDALAAASDDDEVAHARERTAGRRCSALARLAEAAVDLDRRPGDPPRQEVVVHVDAAVLADDAAAGRAYLEGGPALHPEDVRRMPCEASVVVSLEQDHEVLAMGSSKRYATAAQRRALMSRDGGCARPGCSETRVERLHAHHLRHWLHGGPTDLSNLVLLCDVDHGLVHDLGLVMTRRGGELVVVTPDGRRVWGRSDAAFAAGVTGSRVSAADAFVGVHPVDGEVGRRPADADIAPQDRRAPRPEPGRLAERCSVRPTARQRRSGRSSGADRPGRSGPPRPARRAGPSPEHLHRSRPRQAARAERLHRTGAAIGSLLFPAGEPPLPDLMRANGEPMNLAWVVGVLMGNRDLARRLRSRDPGATSS